MSTAIQSQPTAAPAAPSALPHADLVAWGCEGVGTAVMLFLGFSAVSVINATASPLRGQLPSAGLRHLVVGAGFGLAVAAIVVSPLGRRSGAHLNPAVTLALWLRGVTPARDALGYVLAQCIGATAASAAFAFAWGSWSADVRGGRTAPAAGISTLEACCIEALLTFALVVVVLALAGSPQLARRAPLIIGAAITVLIWAGAASTGASFNPARSIGPAIVHGDFAALWVYVVGPMGGAALATVLFAAHRRR